MFFVATCLHVPRKARLPYQQRRFYSLDVPEHGIPQNLILGVSAPTLLTALSVSYRFLLRPTGPGAKP